MATATVTPAGQNYRVKGVVRNHEVYLDEPVDKGGGDTAPGPTELVCTALAACTTITLQMYIQRKEWQVKVISVSVNYEKTEKGPGFDRQIILGGADDQQQTRLLAIANACPIHKLLSVANTIETKMLN